MKTQLMKCRDCGRVARCEALTGKVIEIVEDTNQSTRSSTCIKCFDKRRMKCKCGDEIPAERLEALPDTTTCVRCSTVEKRAVVEVATGTDCEIQFVSPEVAKKVESIQRNFLGY